MRSSAIRCTSCWRPSPSIKAWRHTSTLATARSDALSHNGRAERSLPLEFWPKSRAVRNVRGGRRLGQARDLDDDVQVGRTFPGVDAFQRCDIRVVTPQPDADVLLVDVGVVGRVVVPPAASPGLYPGVALTFDGFSDDRHTVGMQIARDVASRNPHAAQ